MVSYEGAKSKAKEVARTTARGAKAAARDAKEKGTEAARAADEKMQEKASERERGERDERGESDDAENPFGASPFGMADGDDGRGMRREDHPVFGTPDAPEDDRGRGGGPDGLGGLMGGGGGGGQDGGPDTLGAMFGMGGGRDAADGGGGGDGNRDRGGIGGLMGGGGGERGGGPSGMFGMGGGSRTGGAQLTVTQRRSDGKWEVVSDAGVLTTYETKDGAIAEADSRVDSPASKFTGFSVEGEGGRGGMGIF